MNIKRAKNEIKDSIEAYLLKDAYGAYEIPSIRQRPILLLGAPGIGKTQIMEQIAKECGIGLVSYTITHHTRQSAIGLPFISEKTYGGKTYAVTEYTMSEIVASIYNKIEQTGLTEGILFIDEINCVSETLAPAMLQFLQCKTFGNLAIPEGWVIVAAGNPPEYNKSVREFDVVTMDRLKKIDVEPDFASWKEYAYREEIHPAVIAYLNTKPGNFYLMETTVDGKMFATPRGWEDLSRLIRVYEKLKKPVDREVVVQYIQHPRTARDFANYLELYQKYETDYQLEQILEGNPNPALFQKLSHAPFDERFSVVNLLLSGCMERFRKVQRQEEVLAVVFDHLKELQMRSEKLSGADVIDQLGVIRLRIQELSDEKKEAELLTKTEELANRGAVERFTHYQTALAKESFASGAEAFEAVRKAFLADRDAFDAAFAKAGEALEHAFDFLEGAFAGGQELVLFLTELNSSPVCIHFLEEYECERYYQYNSQLLFEDRREELLRRMEQV